MRVFSLLVDDSQNAEESPEFDGQLEPDNRRTITLQIADFGIALTPEQDNGQPVIPQKYQPFVQKISHNILIRVRIDSFIEQSFDRQIVAVKDYWMLSARGDRKIIHRYGAGKKPTHVLLLEPDLSTGKVIWAESDSAHPDSYALRFPLDMLLTLLLLARGRGMLFHAAAVGDERGAYLFAGDSGAGKTTMAEVWSNLPGATLLNDDRVIVRMRDGRFWVYGTPWHRDTVTASPVPFPLEKIFLIQHGLENRAIPVRPAQAVATLLANSFSTLWDAAAMVSVLETLEDLVNQVPCYQLAFQPDNSVVDFVRCLR